MRHHDVEGRGEASDRAEVLLQAVAEILVEGLAEGVVGVGLKDRIAVGDGLSGRRRGDSSAGAWPVQHHHRLPQDPGQRLRHDAPDNVRRAAGRARHDVADGAVRIGLGVGGAGEKQGRACGQAGREGAAAVGCRGIHLEQALRGSATVTHHAETNRLIRSRAASRWRKNARSGPGTSTANVCRRSVIWSSAPNANSISDSFVCELSSS